MLGLPSKAMTLLFFSSLHTLHLSLVVSFSLGRKTSSHGNDFFHLSDVSLANAACLTFWRFSAMSTHENSRSRIMGFKSSADDISGGSGRLKKFKR